MNELAVIEMLKRAAGRQRGSLIKGIGDDCAIYRPRANQDLVFTTDQMIEDVHFTRRQTPLQIGARALARSLSDIAAMGAEPSFALVSLAVPAALEQKWLRLFYRGLFALARRAKTQLAGGDLARAKNIYCDVMVCGTVPRGKALRRDGAQAGDLIYVSGPLGKDWMRPIQPKLAFGKSLRGRATACMDLSDGLSLDLHRLCIASKVAARIHQVPITRGSTLERALHDGEDYELLFTMPAKMLPPNGSKCIGVIEPGNPGALMFQGEPLTPRGWDHFRK